MDILMLVGSLRNGSWTGQLAQSLAELLPEGTSATAYAGLGELPHYDQDLDTEHPPASVVAFRAAVEAADAIVVATPEYNGSLPGVLKNAVDWASRPRGASALMGTPAAVVSVSPSPRGAQWAREDAEKILRVAGAEPLAESVGVAAVHDVLVDGEITDAGVRRALTSLADALVEAAASENQAA